MHKALNYAWLDYFAWGGIMQSINIPVELDMAMNSIEKLLNNKNGDDVLEEIRKFKASKATSKYSYNRMGK